MSLNDGQLHGMAALGAGVLSVVVLSPVVWFAQAQAAEGPVLGEMQVIEASLAYKSEKKKQPQKEKKAPPPDVKPEGVSKDADAKPVEPPKCTQDADCPAGKVCQKGRCETSPDAKPDPAADPLGKFRRDLDDPDMDVGESSRDVGAFDGDKFGFGPTNKGDPYYQDILRDLRWQPPALATGTAAIGCIQMAPEGQIKDIKFQERGDDDLSALAEDALQKLQQRRNQAPKEVPTHLLAALTTGWVCFNFNVKPPD